MVEKMQLLHITGPREDIDRVMDVYLSKYEIHFENAPTSLNNLTNVRPFVETNVYKESYSRAKVLWDYLKDTASESADELSGQAEKMTPAEAERVIDANDQLTSEIMERQETLKRRRAELKKLMQEIEPFRELDYEFRKILEFKYIAFRAGRISREHYHKLERYIHETDYVLFYECHSDENDVWGAYFVPEIYKREVDAVCMSFHFERIYLPDSFEGTPDTAYLAAEAEWKENMKESGKLDAQLRGMLLRHKKQIAGAYHTLESYCENFDIRKMAMCSKGKDAEKTKEYYILYGWMNERDAKAFAKEVKGDRNIQVTPEDVDGNFGTTPPTKLKNPKIFAPFQMFVEMYGLPAYNEMDPTIFIALTYTFMFGAMFGDVGQGLCLVVGGLILYKIRHMNLAAIVSMAGMWSTLFGFLYGSVFGFEELLPAVWMRPMDNIMTTLFLAIGFGMALILVAMVLNVANAIRAKDWGRILFDPSGLCGIICYGTVVLCIGLYVSGHPLPATGILGVLIGVPLFAIFLKEPLSNLVEKKSHIFPEGSKGMFFVESFVELFDVVLSYATNSISFVRVGAFALSHAGMMGVVLTLAGYESGSPNWIVVVLGNIVVTGLEGLVVGIQVLRLEYYEMFSRFYKGSGKPFVAFFKNKKAGGNE